MVVWFPLREKTKFYSAIFILFLFFFPSSSNHQLRTRETSVRREWDIKRSKVERWEIRRHTGSSESLVYELAFLREHPEVLLLLDANVGKGTKGMI